MFKVMLMKIILLSIFFLIEITISYSCREKKPHVHVKILLLFQDDIYE